jgi:type VI secretion system secreted protein Hcp
MRITTESIFRGLAQAGAAGLVAAAPLDASAAENVALYLKANGVDIKGESTVSSLGRADSIECVAFYTSAQLTTAGSLSGGRFTCRKRIDKASPLILRALGQKQQIDATFKFFRPNPTGDGTTEQFYTITLKTGRVISVEQVNPDSVDPATAGAPPLETLTISAPDVVYTITNGGITFQADFIGNP